MAGAVRLGSGDPPELKPASAKIPSASPPCSSRSYLLLSFSYSLSPFLILSVCIFLFLLPSHSSLLSFHFPLLRTFSRFQLSPTIPFSPIPSPSFFSPLPLPSSLLTTLLFVSFHVFPHLPLSLLLLSPLFPPPSLLPFSLTSSPKPTRSPLSSSPPVAPLFQPTRSPRRTILPGISAVSDNRRRICYGSAKILDFKTALFGVGAAEQTRELKLN